LRQVELKDKTQSKHKSETADFQLIRLLNMRLCYTWG